MSDSYSNYDTVDDVDNAAIAHASNSDDEHAGGVNQKHKSQTPKGFIGVSGKENDYEISNDAEVRIGTHPLKDPTKPSERQDDYDLAGSPDGLVYEYEQVGDGLVYEYEQVNGGISSEDYNTLQETRRGVNPDSNYSHLGAVGTTGDLYNTTEPESRACLDQEMYSHIVEQRFGEYTYNRMDGRRDTHDQLDPEYSHIGTH